MNYPIFESIVKNIEAELLKRSIKIDSFRTWVEPAINATGLELGVHLNDVSNTLKDVVINMDWDKFREARLAKALRGMDAHPLSKEKNESLENVKAAMDVEVIWNLEEDIILKMCGYPNSSKRLEVASTWMENINKRANFLLKNEDIMTRWHVELEGDLNGRYVSNMSLISYFQYNLDECHTLLDVHDFIQTKLKHILGITRRLMFLTEECIPQVA